MIRVVRRLENAPESSPEARFSPSRGKSALRHAGTLWSVALELSGAFSSYGSLRALSSLPPRAKFVLQGKVSWSTYSKPKLCFRALKSSSESPINHDNKNRIPIRIIKITNKIIRLERFSMVCLPLHFTTLMIASLLEVKPCKKQVLIRTL